MSMADIVSQPVFVLVQVQRKVLIVQSVTVFLPDTLTTYLNNYIRNDEYAFASSPIDNSQEDS